MTAFAERLIGTEPPARITPARPLRAVPLVAETFETWLVRSMEWNNAEPELIASADSLDASLELGRAHTSHKGHFFVRRTNLLTGAVVDSFYAVRQQSKPTWIKPAGMAHAVQVRPLYETHLFDVAQGDGK